jgi:hypothetical protein
MSRDLISSLMAAGMLHIIDPMESDVALLSDAWWRFLP